MMVIYANDNNSIIVDPLRDRTKVYILQSYQNIIGHLTEWGFKPRLEHLDNEVLQLLQNEMDSKNINWQIVPPLNLGRNVA